MIRTIEVVFVIVIIAGAFIATSYFSVLPSPRDVSPMNLRRLSLTTLQMLDSNYDLSRAAFALDNTTVWAGVQVALSAALPPNVVYNLTVYDISDDNGKLYNCVKSISNAQSFSSTSDVSTYSVSSANVTFSVVAEKLGEHGNGGTLYILNCSDSNGWWITGYTPYSLAQDLYNLLSPYFVNTVMVQNTSQLARILANQTLQGESVQNAVVINTCGEAVPIPTSYCNSTYSQDSYAYYSYYLGQRVRLYNWTWASIVGYPFYYVSNTAAFSSGQNNWGIYGMQQTTQTGVNAFLQGLDGQKYQKDTNGPASDVGVVTFTSQAIDYCNYYGIYPSSYQTSTRALISSIQQNYNLTIGFNVFNRVLSGSNYYYPGAIYNHIAAGTSTITGSFLAIGLTRTPDIRVTCLGLLSYFHPRLYPSEYTAAGSSRLVVLQLGLAGGS